MQHARTSSDDSSLYGDADTVRHLNKRIDSFDPEGWIIQHLAQPGWAQKRMRRPATTTDLHNPYAGVPYAWQLTESVQEFLGRLPPATTDQTLETPWIYICNPYIPRTPKAQSLNQASKGNEDEGTEQEGSRLDMVIEGGIERLELLSKFLQEISNFGQVPYTTEREKNKERSQAALDILHLAHVGKVRAGKWMLFCTVSEVNEVWDIVAKATASNELGIAAKVAPKPDSGDSHKDRLVCVYTKDFMDKADIGRVLKRLRQLGLVEGKAQKIYYKPGGNTWGLKASIYNSSEVFPTGQDITMVT